MMNNSTDVNQFLFKLKQESEQYVPDISIAMNKKQTETQAMNPLQINYPNLQKKQSGNQIIIFIKSLSGGNKIEHKVYQSEYVLQIKLMIQEKQGFPANQQRLIYLGKQLEDEKTLLDYNIQNQSTLTMIVKISGGCFIQDTLITLSNKQKKKIKDIQEGDLVLSYDSKTQEYREDKVTSISEFQVDSLCEIILDRASIFCTPEHQFYDPKLSDWKSPSPYPGSRRNILKVNDNLFEESGKEILVQDIKFFQTQSPTNVYHLLIEYNNNFFVNGILCHNMQIFIKLSDGETFSVNIQSTMTIEEVKQQVKLQKGFNTMDQRLIFAGKELDSAKTLSDYNIQKESTIHLVIKEVQKELYLKSVFVVQQKNFQIKKLDQDDTSEYNAFRIITSEESYFFSAKKTRDFNYINAKIKSIIPEDFILVYGGKIIRENSQMPAQNEFKQSSELFLIENSRGGSQIDLYDRLQKYKGNNTESWINQLKSIYSPQQLNKVFEQIKVHIQGLGVDNQQKQMALPIVVMSSNILSNHINKALGENNYNQWLPFLKDLQMNIRYFPYYEGKAYKRIQSDNQNFNFKQGQYITWNNVIILTKNQQKPKIFSQKQQIILEIDLVSGRDISKISINKDEEEILLMPFSRFYVEEVKVNAGNQKYFKMREICVPRSLQIILWVDDNPKNNFYLAHKIEHQNPNTCVVFCLSTKQAENFMQIFKWILHLDTAQVRIISDMVRKEEDNQDNYNAGLDLAELFFVKYNYSNKILIFCNQVEKAKASLALHKLENQQKLTITKNQADLFAFASFK